MNSLFPFSLRLPGAFFCRALPTTDYCRMDPRVRKGGSSNENGVDQRPMWNHLLISDTRLQARILRRILMIQMRRETEPGCRRR